MSPGTVIVYWYGAIPADFTAAAERYGTRIVYRPGHFSRAAYTAAVHDLFAEFSDITSTHPSRDFTRIVVASHHPHRSSLPTTVRGIPVTYVTSSGRAVFLAYESPLTS